MQCTVVVREESEHRFVARPLEVPEIEATAASESEAIEQVKHKLDEWIRGAKVVEVTVPTGNPWIDTAGRSANDPLFDDYLDEIKRYRAAVDAEDAE